MSTQLVWWERPDRSAPARAIAGLRSFLDEVRHAAPTFRPDRVMVHYSVLSWATAGQPWAVPVLVRALRSLGVPVTAFLHEYAVPVRWGSPGSVAFGAGHRPALAVLLSACDTVVVTTEQRVTDLHARRWACRLPVAFVPVFSNIHVSSTTEPTGERPAPRSADVILGIFGFGTPTYPCATVLGAVAKLLGMGLRVRLRLIGAPGGAGPAGGAWRRAADDARCADVLEFTGVLAESQVSQHLSAVDVLIFPDPGGPAARKGTLAAGLAHGLAVVAFDGPQRWERLATSGAVVLAGPTVDGLTDAVAPLVQDEHLRRMTGDRARRFHRTEMAPEAAADSLVAFLDRAVGARPGGSRTS